MPLGKIFSVIIKVLTNSTVLEACVIVVLAANFATFVQHYHKKPPPVRKAIKKQIAENTAVAESSSGENTGGEAPKQESSAETS